MRPPNSRHSEPRNSHMASLLLDRPVEVWGCGSTSCETAVTMPVAVAPVGTLTSAKGGQLLRAALGRGGVLVAVGHRGLLRPAVDAGQDDQTTDHGDDVVVDQPEPDHR